MGMKKCLPPRAIHHEMFGQRDPAQYETITPAEIDDNRRSPGREPGVVSCPPDLSALVWRCGAARA